MIKKLLVSLLVASMIFTGTVGAKLIQDDPIQAPKPAYIVEIEDRINAKANATVNIVRYENDGETLWIWIDSDKLHNDCDFVMVLEIHPTTPGLYKFITIWSDETIPNSCEYASDKYDEYVEFTNPQKGL
jgi:hypothetical protein